MSEGWCCGRSLALFALVILLPIGIARGFQSDELLQDNEEFGLEGGLPAAGPEPPTNPVRSPIRRRPDLDPPSGSADSKSVQFSLEHNLGASEFSPAGTFTARLKSWSHGGQVGGSWRLPFSPFPSPTLLFSVSRWDLFLAFVLGWLCYSCPVDFLSRWWVRLWCLGWLNYRWI